METWILPQIGECVVIPLWIQQKTKDWYCSTTWINPCPLSFPKSEIPIKIVIIKPSVVLYTLDSQLESVLLAWAPWLLGLVPCSHWPAGKILWPLLKAPVHFPAGPFNLFYCCMQKTEQHCDFTRFSLSSCKWLTNLAYKLVLAWHGSRVFDLSHWKTELFLICLMNTTHSGHFNPAANFFFPDMLSAVCIIADALLFLFKWH